MTTHTAIANDESLGLIAEVSSTIADPQVRNRGTLGGSLAHGDPASDQPAILLAYEGSVTVRGASGERTIAAADLFQDYLTTAVGDDEVITSVNYPALDGYGFGYQKFNRRKEDWAMVAVSALVKKAGDGSCEDVRIGLTHMSNVPLRATAAEEALRGGALDAASDRGGGRAGGGGHRARPATSTPRRTTSATSRGCCAGGRSRRRRRSRGARQLRTTSRGPWPARATSPTGASRRPSTWPPSSSSRCCSRARRAWARPRSRGRWPAPPARA